MAYKSDRLLCDAQLRYLEQPLPSACAVDLSNATCVHGHYVCDSCRSLSANDLIEQLCLSSDETDAVQLAVELMKSPMIKMHRSC